jgi:uncharacterized protein YcbX
LAGDAGTVVGLWRFPVKSMAGERLDAADVAADGLVGDRAFAIFDVATSRLATARYPKTWPGLLACRATFLEPPRAGAELPPVAIALADGTTVRSDDPEVDRALSRFFDRDVELRHAAPPGSLRFGELSVEGDVPEGSLMDLAPVSVLTRSTLARMAELEPRSDFDERRFRMNVIADTPGSGFVESDWVGRTLAVGNEVELAVRMHDPRCVMTTVAQDELPYDPAVLKALGRHNRLEIEGMLYPCAGVYAVPSVTGEIRIGDSVALA